MNVLHITQVECSRDVREGDRNTLIQTRNHDSLRIKSVLCCVVVVLCWLVVFEFLVVYVFFMGVGCFLCVLVRVGFFLWML